MAKQKRRRRGIQEDYTTASFYIPKNLYKWLDSSDNKSVFLTSILTEAKLKKKRRDKT